MQSYARFQAISGLVVLIAYAGFVVWMTDGMALGHHSPTTLFLVLIGIMIGGALLFAGLWVAHMRADGNRHLPDEREAAMEAGSERLAARTTDTGLFVLVLLALSDAQWGWMGSYALTGTDGLIFALFSVAALAGLMRCATAALATWRS